VAERRAVFFWIIAGVLSFWACARLGVHGTPIDGALPWIALIFTAVAWLADSPAVQCAVPLLIACAVCFPDEQTRLLGYGAIAAVGICGAILMTPDRGIGYAVAGTALIRWIARGHVQWLREAIILAAVIAIVVIAKRSTLGIALALCAALYTPAIPFRTLAIPIVFMLAAWLDGRTPSSAQPRNSAASPRGGRGRPPVLQSLALLIIGVILALFPYSGIVARTPRYLRYGKPATNRVNLYWVLKPGQSKDIDVPPDARALILSLSNGANLKRHTVVGHIGDRELHVGDVVDWGFARREEWWRSTNRLPRHAAGLIRGYGYDGWVDGAVRVAIPGDAKTIHVDVDPHLPPQTLLQVEAFER
jgi:hypothetical protein